MSQIHSSRSGLRFSLIMLFGIVTLVAVGFVLLRNASPLWGSVLLTLSIGMQLVAIAGAVYRRNGRRAFWVGFAVFGGAYLALTYGPLDNVGLRLVTSHLLGVGWEEMRRFELPLLPEQIRTTVRLRSDGLVAINERKLVKPEDVPAELGDTPPAAVLVFAEPESPRTGASAELSRARATFWSVLSGRYSDSGSLTIVPSLSDFAQVGHALFSVLAAWIGGLITRWFYATRDSKG